ncbi:MAG TPA: SPOR domain-containing protein [Lamprocystis sp. (in: g-proteobacteria)]|nr:SPOR domain-containing protein [Lamprocystis sp. (in: g-proteobacteria)]
MRQGAKKRLIGAVVIVALAVIFVPMLFEPASLDRLPPIQESMPRAPTFDPNVKTEVFLTPQDSGAAGLDSGSMVSQPLALPPVAGQESTSAGASAKVEGDPGPTRGATNSDATAKKAPLAAGAAKGAPTAPARGANGSMPSWVIQVASVATPGGAAELESKLRAGGFSAFVEKADVNGKVYYRVRVGPELDHARAEQTAARLRERHKVNTLITNYP